MVCPLPQVIVDHAEQWNLMVHNCRAMGGTYMDASECIDGRVPRNDGLHCHPGYLQVVLIPLPM